VINESKILAVIPARGGSKRCPGKNLKEFHGKTLLYWSIEAGKASKYIDHLVVSTEDAGIKWCAQSLGVEVIDRPVKFADDNAINEDVLRHAWAQDTQYDWIVLLQPTSPLRTGTDIDHCIEIADRNGTGCVSYRQRNGTKNGAVYVAHADWLRYHDFSTPLPGVYLMPDEASADLDYAEEFELYE
jgi:CMP-N-acetylneuraminic acid synthetase